MSLYLIGEGELKRVSHQLTADHVQVRSFVWDTYAARLPMPEDTATVAVVDGGELRRRW
jgi:elongator complex protein 1